MHAEGSGQALPGHPFDAAVKRGNRVTVSGTVTNIGERAGDEVVLLNDKSESAGVDVDLAQRRLERG